ncbi:TlpA family protein disulfide reductase [Gelidibacter salicanalis]|uniref:TlpA family protein disulfide reductase n=1 Tax=Gelidibacter salicanalis TaxID=291193 RepID=A0A934NJE1_9FLAO|nr:TlpA disulfide reductase family protein [Gelidibacter salicanalis]MBJ7882403.1 TlpA family protein disulfide reductase [Gelidibacter salicanalis]
MRISGLLLLILLASCKNETNGNQDVETNEEIEITMLPDLEVYDFEGLKPLLKTASDSVYVINFWATWCAPCIKEMPYFEAINKNYKDKKVVVTLVSLDFPKKYDSHLKPFIRDNNIKSRVVVLNDADSNTWIPEIHPDWSGAIPATLIYNKHKRAFYEQPFTYKELETELQKFLN